jgi:hypothetical protein
LREFVNYSIPPRKRRHFTNHDPSPLGSDLLGALR